MLHRAPSGGVESAVLGGIRQAIRTYGDLRTFTLDTVGDAVVA